MKKSCSRIMVFHAIYTIFLFLLICRFSTALAEIDSGVLVEQVNWSITDNYELIISGAGDLPNFTHENLPNLPWYSYRRKITSVIVGDGIESIGDYLFSSNTQIERVSLPETLQSIGYYSFVGCENLREINIPENVSTIRERAFLNCTSLSSITLPGVTSIEASLFEGCIQLESVSFSKDLTSIYFGAFRNCSSLEVIHIPESVSYISNAFIDCSALKEINVDKNNLYYTSIDGILYNKDKTNLLCCPGGREGSCIIPEGVKIIKENAFSNCKKLTSLALCDSITTLEGWAFYGCESIESLYIPESVSIIEHQAFCNCYNLKFIKLPKTLKTLGYQTFYNCTSLQSVRIPQGIKTIRFNTFVSCNNLECIEIPSGVITINSEAFVNCNNLSLLVFPETIEEIEKNIIRGCSNLKKIIYLGSERRWKEIYVDSENEEMQNTQMVFTGIDGAASSSIPLGTKKIDAGAFDGTALVKIILPSGLQTIEDYAFANLHNEGVIVYIPSTVNYISESAFENSKVIIITEKGNYASIWAIKNKIEFYDGTF